MTTHPAPFRLTIAAHAVADLRSHTSASLRLPVTDSGSAPLTVGMHAADVTALARMYPGAGWVRSITPATLHLKPGQTEYFTVHVVVPPNAKGTHYVNFLASARQAKHGQGTIAGGVGGTLEMRHPGHVTAQRVAGPVVITPHHHGGPGVALVVAVALLGAVVALGIAAVFLRRQRGTHRGLA